MHLVSMKSLAHSDRSACSWTVEERKPKSALAKQSLVPLEACWSLGGVLEDGDVGLQDGGHGRQDTHCRGGG